MAAAARRLPLRAPQGIDSEHAITLFILSQQDFQPTIRHLMRLLLHSIRIVTACSQVEALDSNGGDGEMTGAEEPPPKRRKGGGATRAPVPEQHRTSPVAGPAADSDAPHTASAVRADGRKSKAGPGAGVREGWRRFAADLALAERAAAAAEGGFAFAFVEGALVKAVREGHWLLLDEVSSLRTFPNGQAQHACFTT